MIRSVSKNSLHAGRMKGKDDLMKPELEQLCQEYIANRDAVQKAFRWDNGALFSVCANIFCACGKTADPERLKECRKIIKGHTGFRSKFRSKKVRSILAGMLSLAENPEERMNLANDTFLLLKRQFKKTEYLVLTAFLLSDLTDRALTDETVSRGKEIYSLMNRKHRILTDKTDSIFAMLMAFSGKPAEDLTEESETCYQALKKKFSGGGAQTAAQILSMADGTPEDKVQRVTDLYEALREAGIKYGRSAELAPLAALSLADTPLTALTEEIRDVDEFLKTRKGFEGSKDEDQAQRAMYAVMIVSDQYANTDQVNITVMTNTIDMLIAKQQASRLSFCLNALQFLARLIPETDKSSETGKASEPEAKTEAGTVPEETEKAENKE